jgi:hypothetical protein
MTTQNAIDVVRGFQRHRLLREFTDAGQVPADNLAVSGAIDQLVSILEVLRAALVRARPHVEVIALARGTGHVQADCDLRTIDEAIISATTVQPAGRCAHGFLFCSRCHSATERRADIRDAANCIVNMDFYTEDIIDKMRADARKIVDLTK